MLNYDHTGEVAEVTRLAADRSVPTHYAVTADRYADGSWRIGVMVVPTLGGHYAVSSMGVIPAEGAESLTPREILSMAATELWEQGRGDPLVD